MFLFQAEEGNVVSNSSLTEPHFDIQNQVLTLIEVCNNQYSGETSFKLNTDHDGQADETNISTIDVHSDDRAILRIFSSTHVASTAILILKDPVGQRQELNANRSSSQLKVNPKSRFRSIRNARESTLHAGFIATSISTTCGGSAKTSA